MKEAIEQIIKECFGELASDLPTKVCAARLDKAIGIDSVAVENIIFHEARVEKFEEGSIEEHLANAITQSRPLKCEVKE